MRFKVDQNLPLEVAEALRGGGHDAETVYEEGLAGTPDPRLAEITRAEGRALVTLDLGLGDIRTYPPHPLAPVARRFVEHSSVVTSAVG